MTIRIPVDFSQAEEYEALPAGVYSAVVEGITYIEAKAEDKFPQIQCEYTITEDGDLNGRKISQWLSFSPKSLFRMKAFFDAFGITFEDLEIDEETGTVIDPDLSGTVVQIKVLLQPHYLDRTRKVNKIDQPPVVAAAKATRARVAAPAAGATGTRAGARVIR